MSENKAAIDHEYAWLNKKTSEPQKTEISELGKAAIDHEYTWLNNTKDSGLQEDSE